MHNGAFSYGKWICPKEFAAERPIDLLHKEHPKREIELPEHMKNLHVLIRKSFLLTKKEGKTYKLRITADDYYKLHINGRPVGQGPAQGYHLCYYFNEIDLTEHLRDGENEIFAEVYYLGLVSRAYHSGDRRIGMIAELYEGKTCILSTDKSWEYTLSGAYLPSHIIGYDTMFAENFDSRWKPTAWKTCAEKEHDYTFAEKPTKMLQIYEKSPVYTETLENGALFFDFGEEITAGLEICAKGARGSKIRILCGEELDGTPQKVRYKMRCNCRYEEIWTLDDGENTLSQYDYKAFRYVTLVAEDAEILSVRARVRHFPFDDEYCTLETEDDILRAVWQICKNGVKYGSQEVFVDCPHREKGQYAGDLTVTSASHIILTGDLSLFEKAIDNQMQSARICRGLMAVTPGTLMSEIADYSLQFPILALRHYHYTKDKDYLRKCYEVCDGIVSHFKDFEGEDGLLYDVDDKWNLVDWPENLRDNYDFPLKSVMEKGSGAHNVLNAFYVGCVMQTEQIADILDIKRKNESERLKASFRKAFFHEEIGLYTDSKNTSHFSLHSNVLPAFYGISRPEENDAICTLIEQKGLACGVYMAYFILKALCRMGRYEQAYKLIVSKDEHSWYNMVREGATTCFEAWGKAQKWNTSLCHPWASAPISVLAEDILPHMPHIGRLIYKNKLGV
ncbi:MAG: family 78 glycoside hydrolase catalytic domain [Clostridia bacterium]|nr:family 78 glycoside hydrolase catalytic domain [Clostridia bacterium]